MDSFYLSRHNAHTKIVAFVGKNKKVLDIGCARGGLSAKFKENGCYVVGVEVNKEAAEKAEGTCNKVLIGDIENLEVDETFDVIVLADVLEHLKDPLNVLHKLKKNLTEEGYFVVSVPNIANWSIRFRLLFGNFDYRDSGILDKTHMRFFTLKTLKELFSKAGLNIIKLEVTPNIPFITYHSVTEGLSYSLTKLWKRMLANQFILVAKKKCSMITSSIVILNYNGAEDTIECLNSLKNQTFKDFEIILVDNGSKDEEVRKLDNGIKNLNLNMNLVKLEKNLGFTGGNNRGAKIAKGEYIAFLNNDTVVDEHWLENLIKPFLKDKNVYVTAGLIKFYDDREKIQYNGSSALNIFGQLKYNPKEYNLKETKTVPGAAFAIRKSLLEKLNNELFPEHFFAYFEEIDLSWRIFNLGYKIIYVGDAVVYHKVGKSTTKKGIEWIARLNSRNKYLTFYRNLTTPYFLLVFPLLIAYDVAFFSGLILAGQKERAKGLIKGIYEFLIMKKEKSKIRNGLKFLDKKLTIPVGWRANK